MPAVSGVCVYADEFLPLVRDKRVAPNQAFARCPAKIRGINVDRCEPELGAYGVHGAAGSHHTFKEPPERAVVKSAYGWRAFVLTY